MKIEILMKIKTKIFLAAFIFTVTALLVSAEAQAGGLAAVTTSIAAAYRDPSTDAHIIGRYEEGEIVEVIGAEDGWVIVDLEWDIAYIPEAFVTILQSDGLVNADYVNLRRAPSLSSDVLATLPIGTVVTVTGICGEFYVLDYSGYTAYIHSDYIIGTLLRYLEEVSYSEDTTGAHGVAEGVYAVVLPVGGLNLRAFPSSDAPILTTLPYGTALDIVQLGDVWHNVVYEGREGFVHSEYVEISYGQKPDSSLRVQIVNFAKQYLGTRYVWGGTSLTNGVDCSGFVYSVYKSIGVTLNRTSRDQIKNGTSVSKGELLPGDLVFFNTTGSKSNTISHVGIFIGGGQFIHASSSSVKSVTISGLSDAYYARTYVGACRIIK